MVKKMTGEEAWEFKESRCKWFDYGSIEEYIEDIVVCLVYSTWHYTEERARQQCEDRMGLIERSYEKKEPADDCAADVGYCCG